MHAMMQSLWMGVSNNRWTMLLSRWFDLLGENEQRSGFPPWLKNFSNLPIFKITHHRQHRKLHGVEISNNLLQSDLTGLCCWFYLNWCTNPPMHWITTSFLQIWDFQQSASKWLNWSAADFITPTLPPSTQISIGGDGKENINWQRFFLHATPSNFHKQEWKYSIYSEEVTWK